MYCSVLGSRRGDPHYTGVKLKCQQLTVVVYFRVELGGPAVGGTLTFLNMATGGQHRRRFTVAERGGLTG